MRLNRCSLRNHKDYLETNVSIFKLHKTFNPIKRVWQRERTAFPAKFRTHSVGDSFIVG